MTTPLQSSLEDGEPGLRPLEDAERHELECLRARVRQLAYPCSPHCAGYLRELELRAAITTLSRKTQLFADGAKRIYDGESPQAGSGDMWIFELWHHLNDIISLTSSPGGAAPTQDTEGGK